MFDLRNKLEIQDLIEELERNKLTYEVIIDKVIKKGDIVNLEIKIEGKEK